jgi:hypothetical protein
MLGRGMMHGSGSPVRNPNLLGAMDSQNDPSCMTECQQMEIFTGKDSWSLPANSPSIVGNSLKA